jgi:hypothetical protein
MSAARESEQVDLGRRTVKAMHHDVAIGELGDPRGSRIRLVPPHHFTAGVDRREQAVLCRPVILFLS